VPVEEPSKASEADMQTAADMVDKILHGTKPGLRHRHHGLFTAPPIFTGRTKCGSDSHEAQRVSGFQRLADWDCKALRPLGTSRTPPGAGETRATRNGRSQRPVRQLRRRKEGDISYTVPEGSIVIFARAAFLLNLQEIVLAQLVMALSWESGAAERPHLAKSLCAAN